MGNNESCGAIWKRTAKSSGKEYLSIVFTRADGSKSEFIAFENDKGDNDKRPDYKIYKSEPRQATSQPPAAPRTPASSNKPTSTDPNSFTDDIPFD